MSASKDMQVGTFHNTKNCGMLFIKKYNSCSSVEVEFVATGFRAIAEAGDIRKGSVKDRLFPCVFGVGFLGDGKFKSEDCGKKQSAYTAWYNMLLRCYSPNKPIRYKTYDCCEVCSEWHNFQVFAEWYCDNYPEDGLEYELDKDLLSTDIKVYSPSTCSFITGYENKKIAREISFSIVSPDGVIFNGVNIREFSRENGLCSGHLTSVINGKRPHHKGWTRNDKC